MQRLMLARAILKQADIVVLDEATAFADPENEALIQKAFNKLTQGRTVLMIAHRLSTVRNADWIASSSLTVGLSWSRVLTKNLSRKADCMRACGQITSARQRGELRVKKRR